MANRLQPSIRLVAFDAELRYLQQDNHRLRLHNQQMIPKVDALKKELKVQRKRTDFMDKTLRDLVTTNSLNYSKVQGYVNEKTNSLARKLPKYGQRQANAENMIDPVDGDVSPVIGASQVIQENGANEVPREVTIRPGAEEGRSQVEGRPRRRRQRPIRIASPTNLTERRVNIKLRQ